VTGKKRTVSLKLEDFNFDCQSTAYMIDLATGQQIPFNLATNQKLINKNKVLLGKRKRTAARASAIAEGVCLPHEGLLN
jgi:hypothetical protein